MNEILKKILCVLGLIFLGVMFLSLTIQTYVFILSIIYSGFVLDGITIGYALGILTIGYFIIIGIKKLWRILKTQKVKGVKKK